ncbi:MAG TPA: hypothetical protein VF843_02660 [Streptosporangiaceae bacterium]
MNDLTERLADLAAISDADATRLVSERTRADLAERIIASGSEVAADGRGLIAAGPAAGPAGPTGLGAGPGGRVVRMRARRRWVTAAAAAAGVAAAVLGLAFSISVGQDGGHHRPGRPVARVLAFIRHGRYIDVIVRNPYADPARYRAEFRAHHLNISLRLVPASPSIVGTVVYFEGNSSLKVITAQGRCFTGGGGETCPIGFRVPLHYRGSAMLVFGRPARRGEKYESTAPATARGEALHGLRIDGLRVRAVLRLINERHVRVAIYNITTSSGGKLVRHVPSSWFVTGADPWAPGQVMLFASPTRQPQPVPQPSSGQPAPSAAPGAPTPTPTPS